MIARIFLVSAGAIRLVSTRLSVGYAAVGEIGLGDVMRGERVGNGWRRFVLNNDGKHADCGTGVTYRRPLETRSACIALAARYFGGVGRHKKQHGRALVLPATGHQRVLYFEYSTCYLIYLPTAYSSSFPSPTTLR